MAMTRAAPSMKALAMANWPTGPQPQTATVSPGLDLGILGRHVAGGKDVGEEEDFFVGQIAFDLQRTDVGEGHAHVLRLAAGVAAHHVRVAEETGAGISVGGFHQVRVGIGVVAGGPELLLAEEAVAAGDGERNDDAVAALEIGHFLADFLDDAHEFVAEDVARFHGGDEAVEEMKVRSADRGAGDFDDGVVRD